MAASSAATARHSKTLTRHSRAALQPGISGAACARPPRGSGTAGAGSAPPAAGRGRPYCGQAEPADGRRHYGSYDITALSDAVLAAKAAATAPAEDTR